MHDDERVDEAVAVVVIRPEVDIGVAPAVAASRASVWPLGCLSIMPDLPCPYAGHVPRHAIRPDDLARDLDQPVRDLGVVLLDAAVGSSPVEKNRLRNWSADAVNSWSEKSTSTITTRTRAAQRRAFGRRPPDAPRRRPEREVAGRIRSRRRLLRPGSSGNRKTASSARGGTARFPPRDRLASSSFLRPSGDTETGRVDPRVRPSATVGSRTSWHPPPFRLTGRADRPGQPSPSRTPSGSSVSTLRRGRSACAPASLRGVRPGTPARPRRPRSAPPRRQQASAQAPVAARAVAARPRSRTARSRASGRRHTRRRPARCPVSGLT